MKPISALANATNHMVLMPLSSAWLRLILDWRNAPETRRWFFDDSEITWEAHREWYARYCDDDDDLMWVIFWKGRPVGTTALYHLERRCAEYGRLMIGEPSAHGHNLAYHASVMVRDYAFNVLNLDYIYGYCKPDNEQILHIDQRTGFVVVDTINGRLYMRLDNPKVTR